MSFVRATPQALVAAASEVAGIGSSLSAAHAAAAAPTTGVLAAAADEVSTEIAVLFSRHAQGYHQLSARVAVFHEQFVEALAASASNYAAAEAAAAQTLLNALNAPTQAAGSEVGRVVSHAGNVVAHAVSRVEGAVVGNGAVSALSSAGSSLLGGSNVTALLDRPTAGFTAAGTLLHAGAVTNASAAPAAFGSGSVAAAIENLYNFVEPYVAYVFDLASYVVRFLPWIGILAPQINFIYYLFEPIVQSGLFNTLDWLAGTISFSQGLSNFWTATTESINQFIYNEIYWVRSFFPPLPPLP
jgi:PE family